MNNRGIRVCFEAKTNIIRMDGWLSLLRYSAHVRITITHTCVYMTLHYEFLLSITSQKYIIYEYFCVLFTCLCVYVRFTLMYRSKCNKIILHFATNNYFLFNKICITFQHAPALYNRRYIGPNIMFEFVRSERIRHM